MKKIVKRIGLCLCFAALVWCGALIADRKQLNDELIRLHIVANSDSEADQGLKLQVRDAVTQSLSVAMADISDVEQAKKYLQDNLQKLEALVNRVLQEAGCTDTAEVSLTQEEFDTRVYDTFTLPAGIYEALRIVIGQGQGHNWWCVVFPSLCLPATSDGFESMAVSAGFPEELTAALTGEDGYELRFFLLDVMGKLKNLLHNG